MTTASSRLGRFTNWSAAVALALGGAAAPAAAQGWTEDGRWVERGDAAYRYDVPGRVGRLAFAEGRVWFYDVDDNAWAEARPNRPLAEGDRVAVDRGGRAVVRIGATVVWLDGGSDLLFDDLDDDHMRLQLLAGSMAVRVPSREQARQTEFVTPEGRIQPLRSGHYRVDREDDQTFVAVWRGEAQFDGNGNLRRIDDGERVRFWQEGWNGRVRSDEVAWVRDRFGAWAEAEYRGLTDPPAYRYASPDITGVEELDRWGRWDSHPEFGFVWFPYTVPVGWAPYRDGRWVWTRPWGWTWVDAAPWGFAPFHYGRWVRWEGRWAWWPGVRHQRPVFSPGLVATAGGPNFGVSVVIGGQTRPPPPRNWQPLPPHQVWTPIHRPPPVVVIRPPAYRPPPFVAPRPGHEYPQPLPQPGRRHPRPPDPVWTGPVSPGQPGGPAPVGGSPRPAPPPGGAGAAPRPPEAQPLPRILPPPVAVFGPSPEVRAPDPGPQPTYRPEVIRDAREQERRPPRGGDRPDGDRPPMGLDRAAPSALPPQAVPRGPVMRPEGRDEIRPRGPRPEQAERPERPERQERAERGERPDRRDARADSRRRDQVQ